MSKLKEVALEAPLIQKFVQRVESWCLESKRLKGRRFLLSLKIDVNNLDPWERLFNKLIVMEMIKDAKKHIVGADVIVFVEGITDAKVFEKFAKKLVPQHKIVFMEVEGFTNMHYYSEAKLTKSLNIPTFVIFDGDTSTIERKRKIKNKLVELISLPEEHIITLKKNSIEDYLLVPSAIKRTFPSIPKSVEKIDVYFKKRKNDRNKKRVLENLFREMGLGKYDHEKASSIASKMKVSEIDQEIVSIFRTLRNGWSRKSNNILDNL